MDDEIQINGGESLGDDFYEKIEAPKFVDLSAPDHYRPENDDRYWFCLRVGCDQKHEEEMDSEAIYKDFVLRVMAARSPNVRLRKALYREDPSANVKCPLTVPAKSSKSRMSRLALVSSISQKMVDGKVKGRPLFKQCETPKKKEKQSSVAAKALTTPRNKKHLSNLGTFRSVRNLKPTALAVPKNRMVAKALVFHSPKKTVRMNLKKSAEQSSVAAKALTTPRNKKCLSNLGTFQSVRNPKPTALAVPKNRMVAKALVFHSPKKTVRVNLKKSAELSNSMRKLCVGMKKLEITSGKKHVSGCNKPLPVDALKKQFRGREVKSRVYDSLHLKNCQGKEAKSSKCSKKKNEELHCGPAPCEGTEIEYSDMEIEEQSRDGSLEVCSTSGISKNNEGNQHKECFETQKTLEFPLGENKAEAISDTSDNNINQQVKSSPEKGIKLVIEKNDNENASVSDDKENENEVMNHDDKENASVSNDNRKLNSNTSQKEKKEILSKHETSKSIRTVTRVNKTSKGNSTSAVTCAEGVNCKKPKLTNPKPFHLRTDERRILKEANLEKKLLETLQETSTKGIHQNTVQQRKGTSCSPTSKAAAERKESVTPRRNTVSTHQKTKLAASRQELSQSKATKKSEGSLKNTKSPCTKQLSRTQGIEQPSKRKTISLATPGRLGVIKELSPTILRTKVTAKTMENGASPATKASSTSSTPRPSLLGRKPATIPKEPHFHSIHVPKSCTRRAA